MKTVLSQKHADRRRFHCFRLAARFIGKTFCYTDEYGFPHSIRLTGRQEWNAERRQWEEKPYSGVEVVYSWRGVWNVRSFLTYANVQREFKTCAQN